MPEGISWHHGHFFITPIKKNPADMFWVDGSMADREQISQVNILIWSSWLAHIETGDNFRHIFHLEWLLDDKDLR